VTLFPQRSDDFTLKKYREPGTSLLRVTLWCDTSVSSRELAEPQSGVEPYSTWLVQGLCVSQVIRAEVPVITETATLDTSGPEDIHPLGANVAMMVMKAIHHIIPVLRLYLACLPGTPLRFI